MKSMKLIQTTALLLTLILPINYALADTSTDIISWLDATSLKAAYDSATKSNVTLSNITPIIINPNIADKLRISRHVNRHYQLA
jgi:hypothetical protein